VPSGSKAASTLLRGIHLDPQCAARVAAFDLDGTLIKSSLGKGASKDAKGKGPLWWEWWRRDVPGRLKELVGEG
jgi:bifunctional polynucleotide phosphatase/kinase